MIVSFFRNARQHLLPFICKDNNVAKILTTSYCTKSNFKYDDGEYKDFLRSLSDGGSVELMKDEDTGIAIVKISDPKVRNALSGNMMAELRDVVGELARWESGKGVLLCGAEGTFCSGGNLNFMRSILNQADGYKMSRFMSCTLNRLHNLPLISVALLEGACLGGGMEIATACDFRLMTSTAKIGFVQARMGLVPGWGGAARLVQLLGRCKALDVLSSGHVFQAEEAVRYGLVDHVIIENEDAQQAAMKWLQQRVKWTVEVTRAIKAVVMNGSSRIDQYTMAKEEDIFAGVWSGPAHCEALDKK